MTGPWWESRFVRPYVGRLSDEAVDLLSHILAVDPAARYDLDQIQAHPWMRRCVCVYNWLLV